VYVRGEAYLAARQGTEAIAEFQKILDHRGIVISDPNWRTRPLANGRGLRRSRRQGQSQVCLPEFP